LSSCLGSHRLCNLSRSTSFTPTRLIEVDGRSQSSVRLVELRSQEGEPGGYATLSHCWGGVQVVRLMTANRESFSRSIPTASLPLTFQHAVAVVRVLGIKYLWIDSLCIVQDSVADWEVESSLMAKVYGHAVVNIAATSSPTSAGGLFFDRDPDTVQPFAVYSPGHEALKLQAGWYAWKDDGRWGRLGREPLNQRAWVLQERLLSTRTAHFTASEIMWQCLEDLSSETVPEQFDNGRLSVPVMQIGDYTDIKIAIAKARCDGLTAQLKDEMLNKWLRALSHYSTCGLSVDSDKLIAIDGMVHQLAALTGDECLAGLWRSQLPACLLWSVGRDVSDDSVIRKTTAEEVREWKPRRWRAPSWSWASHN
ncbi:heterokaryon incompatibility protein-domain-containing protein, partial [Cercophora newfieldiana]